MLGGALVFFFENHQIWVFEKIIKHVVAKRGGSCANTTIVHYSTYLKLVMVK
jgi:hypothetical protein